MSSSLKASIRHASLRCHPASLCEPVREIRVAAQRLSESELKINYQLLGGVSSIIVPDLSEASRRDELWRHTCAEMYIGVPESEAYFEFNFSPSAQWAAYEFTSYRQGMRAADCIAPQIVTTRSEHELLMIVMVSLPAQLESFTRLQIGISTVIEESVGQCSYWALRHDADRPDFHNRDGFVLNL